MTDPYAIEAQDIHRSLPMGDMQLNILRGITFQIEPGEWIALTGPSGSGKSTLLGIMAGIDQPTSGQLLLGGQPITGLPEQKLARIRNEKIGIVFQSFNLIPTMTAQENVEAPLYVGPQARHARRLAQEMLALVGLDERRRHLPHQLSGGEQQRVAIARALVTRPQLVLADEPTGNLDSTTSEQIMQLFRRLQLQLGLTLTIVTHDPQVAAYAGRILHMVDGQLTEPPVRHNGSYSTARSERQTIEQPGS